MVSRYLPGYLYLFTMAKIEAGLSSAIHTEPGTAFDVIIVVKEDSIPQIASARLLMKNIFAAKITGHEILSLAEEDAILSIERDADVRAF